MNALALMVREILNFLRFYTNRPYATYKVGVAKYFEQFWFALWSYCITVPHIYVIALMILEILNFYYTIIKRLRGLHVNIIVTRTSIEFDARSRDTA